MGLRRSIGDHAGVHAYGFNNHFKKTAMFIEKRNLEVIDIEFY
ncbi:hypothetical protein [Bacillus rubiinfantis]|nr:hypothetical protein [Bacillus rubiinfantis]